jgi:hypothetical protein
MIDFRLWRACGCIVLIYIGIRIIHEEIEESLEFEFIACIVLPVCITRALLSHAAAD